MIKVDLSEEDGEALALELGVSEGFPLFQIRSATAQLAQFGPCSLAEARGEPLPQISGDAAAARDTRALHDSGCHGRCRAQTAPAS